MVYANYNKIYKYKDIINFLKAKNYNNKNRFPKFINDIKGYNKRKNKKRNINVIIKNIFMIKKIVYEKILKIIRKMANRFVYIIFYLFKLKK